LALVAAGLITALLVGCGGQDSAEAANKCSEEVLPKEEELSVALDGYEGPETAGIVMAQGKGFFYYDGGVNVSATIALEPMRAITYVASGSVDLGVTHQPQVVMAKEKGAPIVAIGSLISQPTAAMIWLKRSKIGGIADLKGKTIAIPGLPFQKEFLGTVLARKGLTLSDVKVKSVRYDLLPSLISGDADAIFGGSWNLEGAALEAGGLEPVVTPVKDQGIPPYDELVVIARTDRLAKDPGAICGFMSALSHGTAAAIKDPKGVTDTIDESIESDPELSREELEAGVEATLPLLSKSGSMSPGQANKLVDWMFEEGMIQRKLKASEFLTNAYLSEP
jgi:putative hydroxymethylpyrimidine transport system substrate-binding protein